jgi:hypothetical protein
MQVIKAEDLLDVADEAQHWYAAQGDPVYALVSSVYAGQDVPLDVAEDALRNLERDYRKAKKRLSADAQRDHDLYKLEEAIYELRLLINEVRTHAARLPNPLSLRTKEYLLGGGLLAAVIGVAVLLRSKTPPPPVKIVTVTGSGPVTLNVGDVLTVALPLVSSGNLYAASPYPQAYVKEGSQSVTGLTMTQSWIMQTAGTVTITYQEMLNAFGTGYVASNTPPVVITITVQ